MAAKRKSKKQKKISNYPIDEYPFYPFDLENDEKYEPTKKERSSLAMKTILPSGRSPTKIDYMQWKRQLEKYGYNSDDLKRLNFSESLMLTHKCVCESIAKNLPSRRRLYEPMLKKEFTKFNQRESARLSQKQSEAVRKEKITLKKFIETYCDLTGRPDIVSKASLLHEYNRKKRIELPKVACKYKKGKTKFYFTYELIKNWSEYKDKCPSLPRLKNKSS